MTEWCTTRSMAAAVAMTLAKMRSHSEKTRLDVMPSDLRTNDTIRCYHYGALYGPSNPQTSRGQHDHQADQSPNHETAAGSPAA